MSENTSGIYRLVTVPAFYRGFQAVLGADAARRRLRDELLSDIRGKSILEIGCGPGTWAPLLAEGSTYFGVDWNPDHIAEATRLYGSPTCHFVCGDITDPAAFDPSERFDVILGVGVLHHLNDTEAASLLATLFGRLTPTGRFVGFEPVFHPGQHPFAKWMKHRDSGQNIRTEEGYRALFPAGYDRLNMRIATDFLRVPYSHILIEGKRAK